MWTDSERREDDAHRAPSPWPFDGFAIVARCNRVDTLRAPQETRPGRNVELRRYREAGADDAVRYRFPASHAEDEAFFLTDLMEDYSDSVILEGDTPMPHVDLSVFVAEPSQEGAALLVRKIRDRAREEAEKIDAVERLLEEPGGVSQDPRTEPRTGAGAPPLPELR